jgi:predicted dehydrogenase
MNIAIVGCGFVADYYITTLANHPGLTLVGVHDTNSDRQAQFTAFHGLRGFESIEALLAEPAVTLVVNLTPPHSHFVVSSAALDAGKHVYSEKPLAMRYEDAARLVSTASAKGLTLGAAPATVLGDAATACWRALAEGRIGQPRLAYAAMEDGQVFRDRWRDWRSKSGAPWPGTHEFEIGCALEHAGYYLTWLCAFFGPVRTIHPFAMRLFDDKGTGQPSGRLATDYQSAHLVFESGMVARITCGLAAERDRTLQIIADAGSLLVDDGWNNRSTVRLKQLRNPDETFGEKLARAGKSRINRLLPGVVGEGIALPLPGSPAITPPFPSQIDFMRGVADQAAAIARGESPGTGGAFALHVTELALLMQNAGSESGPITLRSRFEPLPAPLSPGPV